MTYSQITPMYPDSLDDVDDMQRCEECNGFGQVLVNVSLNPNCLTENKHMTCPVCHGVGVDPEDEENYAFWKDKRDADLLEKKDT